MAMLGQKIFEKNKINQDEEEDYKFSTPLFISLINLAFESFMFPFNTMWQLFKLTK